MSQPLPSYIQIQPGDNDHAWRLPLTTRLCVGPPDHQFMFGGVGLGSAIHALEQTCQRRVIWATAQYLSYARPGDVVELTVKENTRGRYNTQAQVISRVGDQEILIVNAALGSRPSEITRQWLGMPAVLPPLQCKPINRSRGLNDGLHKYLETHIAETTGGEVRIHTEDGRVLLWIRPREGEIVDPAMLAIMADFVPMGVGFALGKNMGGNSLDNTIRIHRMVETEWVLADLQISGVHDGFGHGACALFSENGDLMATASQSIIIRSFRPPQDVKPS